jgi:hypothetical protein
MEGLNRACMCSVVTKLVKGPYLLTMWLLWSRGSYGGCHCCFCPSMIGLRKAHFDIELGVVVLWSSKFLKLVNAVVWGNY